ncbi:hypothetical protein [Pseudomonas folii]|jgi:hypothetical protein|uniref:Uncharacterized protein n=1 Tax=Pseudomonas folii TaxID=2762593 RepID=A0ABR7B2Z4_9PSED|nr:hypothetical protein [Pseudomonas folii]MBC3951551.1 hypothetical protein [Pseudomonas folii]
MFYLPLVEFMRYPARSGLQAAMWFITAQHAWPALDQRIAVATRKL